MTISPEPYTVQFAITIDMKNGRYRYTVQNVIFYLPTDGGNRRQTCLKYIKKRWTAMQGDMPGTQPAKRSGLLNDTYNALTNDLHADIENKTAIHDPKF